ncbi:ArsR/SmtB family transcription factor [Methanobacterium petrolearium]|uniref:ArsR/SmtB family transcription factor n=1 Tax=Methanobacterium petrolearium TaxID=710190 RepID=UPI001AE25CCE|nr:metalloregulator ArsR/SmtB family transcription factor [Methanobacterium petrolearium]MBP1946847.1 ArsR family transcriptional regulator [Methanobacterium petrolearium]BDZ70459.1 transcriptional regulator [Methanobacterium petrolearium]
MKCQISDEKLPGEDQIKKLEEIMSHLPDDNQFQEKSEIFKAIADPTRLKILYLLEEGELCVCEVIMALDKPQSTISHHLNVLKNAKLIKWRKEGVWIHYKLADPKIVGIIGQFAQII